MSYTPLPAPGTAGNVVTSTGSDSWTSAPGSGGGVTSVNGQTGAVVLDATDVGADPAGTAAAAVAALAPIASSGSATDLTAGTVPAARMPAHTGDVTSTSGSVALTIANDAVTFAKMQNVNTDRLLGRDTAGVGDVEEISLGASLSFNGAGALQRAALTGDVTAAVNSNATTIAANAVTNTKLRDSAALSVIGRASNTSGDPADIAAAADGDVLRRSGTTLGFGSVPAGSVSGLAAIATSGSATDLVAGTVSAARMPALSGDVTSVAGTTTTSIANDAVTNAKLANMASASLKGNNTGVSADPVDLTVAQVNTMLGTVTGPVSSTDNGLVRFDGVTGKVIQDGSGVTLSDTGVLSRSGTLTVSSTGLGGQVIISSSSSKVTLTSDDDTNITSNNYINVNADKDVTVTSGTIVVLKANAGLQTVSLSSSSLSSDVPVLTPAGTSSAPGHSFVGATAYGMFQSSQDTGIAANGAVALFTTKGGTTPPQIQMVGDGSAAAPSFTWDNDATTGFWRDAANGVLAVSYAGSEVFGVGSTAMTSLVAGGAWIRSPAGTATTPTYSFHGDTNTGIHSPVADNLYIATGGVDALQIDSSQRVFAAGLQNSGGNHVLQNPFFATANLTSVKTLTSGTSFAVYLGKAPKSFGASSVIGNIRLRVTTAAATITWAEVAIATGNPVAGGNPTLTVRGFANVAAVINSTGQKTISVSTSAGQTISAGDGMWLIIGNSATTAGVVRAQSIADDIQSGVQASKTVTRPSTILGAATAFTIEGATTLAAWASLVI